MSKTIGPCIYDSDHNAPIYLLINALQEFNGLQILNKNKQAVFKTIKPAIKILDEMRAEEVMREWRSA